MLSQKIIIYMGFTLPGHVIKVKSRFTSMNKIIALIIMLGLTLSGLRNYSIESNEKINRKAHRGSLPLTRIHLNDVT